MTRRFTLYSRRYSEYLRDHGARLLNAEAVMSNAMLGRRGPYAPETNNTQQLTGEVGFKDDDGA